MAWKICNLLRIMHCMDSPIFQWGLFSVSLNVLTQERISDVDFFFQFAIVTNLTNAIFPFFSFLSLARTVTLSELVGCVSDTGLLRERVYGSLGYDNTLSASRIHQLLRNLFHLGRWSSSGSDRGIAHFFTAQEIQSREWEEKEQTNNMLGLIQVLEGWFCDTVHSFVHM